MNLVYVCLGEFDEEPTGGGAQFLVACILSFDIKKYTHACKYNFICTCNSPGSPVPLVLILNPCSCFFKKIKNVLFILFSCVKSGAPHMSSV